MKRFVHSATSAIVCALLGCSAFADVPPGQRAEVGHLIAYLATSHCVMIRNGKRHDGEEAAQHVRRKYEHFREKIATTEDFIARSATKSMMSGRPYQVQCPGEKPLPSSDWLLAELAAFRSSRQDQ